VVVGRAMAHWSDVKDSPGDVANVPWSLVALLLIGFPAFHRTLASPVARARRACAARGLFERAYSGSYDPADAHMATRALGHVD
jgi:hypothetical protein